MTRATERMVERMGLNFQADGLPRIAGRLLGVLLLEREARSLDELSATLRVSKASASSNARLLERLGVLERLTRPGDRRDYYAVAQDFHLKLLEMALHRLRQTRELLGQALASPEAEDPAVCARLKGFTDFFGHMLERVGAAGEAWSAKSGSDDSAGLNAAA